MFLSNLYKSYTQSEIEWENIAKNNIGINSILLIASPHIPDARTYRFLDRVIKIRKTFDNQNETTKLQKEYKVIIYLDEKMAGLKLEPKYKKIYNYELLSMNYKTGTLLERYIETNEITISHVFKTALTLLRINLIGVSHRDITSSNIKVSERGDIVLIDFDQACITSPFKAFLNDFLGISLGVPKAIHPLRKLVQRIIFCKFIKIEKLANKIYHFQSKNNQTSLILPLSEKCQMTPGLDKLEAAWALAAHSNANTPGITSAYYSLCLEGYGFLGERSWESRWKAIKDNISFKNKRVLELGCNMGLFSTFMRLQGAKECVGLDVDENVIHAARLVASAFGIVNTYKVEDFDRETWADKYQGFDIVIALSVLNWLKKKDEFLNFLAKHQELIYEGHNSFQVEYDRLKSCGFNFIQIISVSERGRIIFYAKK